MIDKLPELLSPCGSPETVKAAAEAGADAVYLGGQRFNARANARNFTDTELQSAIEYCHSRGVRVYITFNTLQYDRELSDALSYAGLLYQMGADALIAADMGFIKLLRERLPAMPVHVSTQAAVHNLPAIYKLSELGAGRVVVARELSHKAIEAICKDSPVEIEMFIHGALCVSCSGQCLLSAVMGGRSGNRGDCAQPCRLPYETLAKGQKAGVKNKRDYPISLRDLCLADYIPELISAGVSSLKIEGRMKSPDYVYGVTRIYRRLLDEGRRATTAEIEELSRIFSRGGFTDAYFTEKGSSLRGMLGIRSGRDKAASQRMSELQRLSSSNSSAESHFPEPETKAGTFTKAPIIVMRSKPDFDALYNPKPAPRGSAKLKLGVFRTPEQIPAADYFDAVFLPPQYFEGGKANGIALPPVINDLELPEIKRLIEAAKSKGARYIMIENIGQLSLAGGFYAIGGIRLNITNTAASQYYLQFLQGVILSPELILPQIRDIGCKEKGALVYGRLPLMTFAGKLGENTIALRDRTGSVFPVHSDGARDILYNSVPVYMADRVAELDSAGVRLPLYSFTTETKSEAAGVIDAYKRGLRPPNNNIKRIK